MKIEETEFRQSIEESYDEMIERLNSLKFEINRGHQEILERFRDLHVEPSDKQDYFDALRLANTTTGHILRIFEGNGELYGRECRISEEVCIELFVKTELMSNENTRVIVSKVLEDVMDLKKDNEEMIPLPSLNLDFFNFYNVIQGVAVYAKIPIWDVIKALIGPENYKSCMSERKNNLDIELMNIFPDIGIKIQSLLSLKMKKRKENSESKTEKNILNLLKDKFLQWNEIKEDFPLGINQHMSTYWILESGILRHALDAIKVDDIFASFLNREDRRYRQNLQGSLLNFTEFVEFVAKVNEELTDVSFSECISKLLEVKEIQTFYLYGTQKSEEKVQLKEEPEIVVVDDVKNIYKRIEKVAERMRSFYLTNDQRERLRALFKVFSLQAIRRTTKLPGGPRLEIDPCTKWLRQCEIVDEEYDQNFLDKDFRIIIQKMHKRNPDMKRTNAIDFESFLDLIELIAARRETRPEAIASLIFHGPFEGHLETLKA
ncbi:hypothetical protein ACOME3_006123 [Neoechinorhynchus agilis]